MKSLPSNCFTLSLSLSLLIVLLAIVNLGRAADDRHDNFESCPRIQPNGCKIQQRSHQTRQNIYFGLMLSFVDTQSSDTFVSSFDDGHDLAPAVHLAVEQVNNRSDLLKDYYVQIIGFDGGCNVSVRTSLGINELFCRCEPIVGIIGPSCDDSSRIE